MPVFSLLVSYKTCVSDVGTENRTRPAALIGLPRYVPKNFRTNRFHKYENHANLWRMFPKVSIIQPLGHPAPWSSSPLVIQPLGHPAPWSSIPLVIQPLGHPAPWSSNPLIIQPLDEEEKEGLKQYNNQSNKVNRRNHL